MAQFNAQKHWWIVVIAAAVVGIAAIMIADQGLPDNKDVGVLVALGLIGVSFCWAYFIDRERLWWTIIPGLGALTLLAALLSDYIIGTDPTNDWINVLVIGVGAAIIGAVLQRPDAKLTLLIVSVITILVGVAMSPLTIVLKIVALAAVILVAAFFLWRNRSTLISAG